MLQYRYVLQLDKQCEIWCKRFESKYKDLR